MASPAHCFYCFESLAASYEGKEPPSLTTVEELWMQYEQFNKVNALKDNRESGSLGETDDLDPPIVDDDGDNLEASSSSKTETGRSQALKPPGVSRLQSQSSSDSSSSTSIASNNSSHSMLSSTTSVTTPSSRDTHYPLFVTWNTISRSGEKSLRGCIGTFEAQELSAGLKSYALTSAFDDSRFSPISSTLLPSLSCSLTLLGSFEPCTNAMDWILGTHGLRISFVHRGRRHGATYLPDVPVEQGWTKEETVRSLMHKAGWDGATESTARRFLRGNTSTSHNPHSSKPWEQVSDFRTVKYQGLKASASYAEWQAWREWVLSLEDGAATLS